MKVLVAIKRVVDYNVHVRVKSDGSGVEMDNVKMSMNPPDENAVEEAIRLKEAGNAVEITGISIGAAKSQETLRTGLAMGLDNAIHVNTDSVLEPLAVAKVLKKITEDKGFDLVLLGKQAIDDDSNQTGQMLAALLNRPQGTFASELKVDGDNLIVTRETDDGLMTIQLQSPAVITCDLRLNEPRYPSLPNIMKAKKKPLETIELDSLGLDTSPRLETLHVSEPSARSKGVMVSSVAELLDKLKNTEKVI